MTGSDAKSKISLTVIGDAFADVFCLLNNGPPPLGGDVRVTHPMKPVAGGSGLNTSTHLNALIKDFSSVNEGDELMDVTLQTAFNENDYYGKVLLEHAKEHGFQMINCKGKKKISENGEDSDSKSSSTGHCIVLVTEGERSFVTHLGVMESFKASDTVLHELVQCRTADPAFKNHHHHIHVAGYYNLPGFSKGNLKRRLKKVRERRRCQSHGLNTFTTTSSLVPQYDATEEWDGGLVDDILPLVDFLILNALEAGKISKIGITEKDFGGGLNRTILLSKLADFFWTKSPLTHVIITLGKLGAVCLYQGEVVASIKSPKRYNNPVDPTGAGDAFCAGFLFGLMEWRKQHEHEDCAEIGSLLEGSWLNAIMEGMRYGCSTGTACVTRTGASLPAPKDEIDALLNMEIDEEYSSEDSEYLPQVESEYSAQEEEGSYYSEYEDDSNYESSLYSEHSISSASGDPPEGK